MSYIKIRVEKNLPSMDLGIRRTIDEMFRLINPVFTLSRHTWRPHTDIFETDSEIVIASELAGVKMEDIHVEMDRNTLKIYGIRREMPHHETATYILAEIPSGHFERTFTFSTPVDTEVVSASYLEGLLYIRLKKHPGDITRSIPIHCT
ncbi:MAG: heat-shock protein Hsp20 [Syntrophobacteraceae bacterium CG23_combo_of_CG06-09_8_20_14_all_50_8]|nr:MAG: heat-shock protein Hsp20 [Syntrophobacteraceae bacterium CG23_combo_of_CG06-09_8_20_14_all_50_8]